MITTMPAVDRSRAPQLADLVQEYAMRYEFRLDGSSLWEGRARLLTDEDIDKMERLNPSESGGAWAERMRRYPRLDIPSGWTALAVSAFSAAAGCRYYHNASEHALLALQDIDIFLVQHPSGAGFRWELDRIETALRQVQTIVRPRELLTGYEWTLAYRCYRTQLDGFWL